MLDAERIASLRFAGLGLVSTHFGVSMCSTLPTSSRGEEKARHCLSWFKSGYCGMLTRETSGDEARISQSGTQGGGVARANDCSV